MNHRKLISILVFVVAALCLAALQVFAQPLTQTLKGKITDHDSKSPIIGANVIVENSDPIRGGSTDINGEFKIDNVPIGRVNLKITSIGYEDAYIPNLLLGTGKELFVEIQLRESLQQLSEVVIMDKANKGDVDNEMALVSARAFSVEETRRYAGSFNDPARLVVNFVGVQGNSEGSNHIVVRGNSPNTVQWRMDGIEIPNPNHFADEGSSGGAINMLNSAMLTNSDFYTGAYSSEYGNVLGAVFDMKMRTGNNEKNEYSLSAGILGTDITVEGPFRKGGRSSYLANYRYSTLAILDDLGIVDFGGVPKYQDLSFKFAFPTNKAGYFSVFGLAGKSGIHEETEDEATGAVIEKGDYTSSMGTLNINHVYFFTPNASIETFVSASQNGSESMADERDESDEDFVRFYEDKFDKYTYRFATAINNKLNAKNTIKTGIRYDRNYFEFNQKFLNKNSDEMESWLNDKNNAGLIRAYATWKFRMTEKLTFTTGMQYIQTDLNNASSIEPRLSSKWQFRPDQSLFGGFGMHSQMVSLPVYFSNVYSDDGSYTQPNTGLGLMKANHFVLGYDRYLNPNVYLKLEAYYQDLYDIPVENDPHSSYSLINASDGYTDRALVNSGTGYNYGLELTLERYFSRNYYYLFTASLYESKYKAMDGITRSTMFNSNYLANALFGKEFYLMRGQKNKVLSVNAKISLYGARNFTPIDLNASNELGRTVLFEDQAYSKKGDDIWKVDLGVTYSWNKSKTRQELKLDIQNLTDSQGKVDEYYNSTTEKIDNSYQMPMFPVLMYTIEF